MPYAINLFFDATTEATIRSLWQAIAEVESATYLHQSGARPHIKLAVYQTLELSAVEQRLQQLAATVEAMPVIFKQIGLFPNPNPTVFLGPTVTEPLLALQKQVCEALHDIGSDFSADYFATGQWVPHCLLALAVEPAHLTTVLDIGARLTLPFEGQLQGIGVVEFRPPKQLLNFQLRNPLAE